MALHMTPCECQDPCIGIGVWKTTNSISILQSSIRQGQGSCSASGIWVSFKTPGYVIRFGGYVLHFLHGKLCSILPTFCINQDFQKATHIKSSKKQKCKIKVIVVLWIMVKQLQIGPNTVKYSYLFTATTYSIEHEIRPNRYFTVWTCSFLSLFPSLSLLQSSQVLF